MRPPVSRFPGSAGRCPRSGSTFLLQIAAAVLVALGAPSSFAIGLLVSPTQLGLVGKPGQVVSGTLRVSSSKEQKNHITVGIVDFTRDEEGKVVEINDSKPHPRSCRSWIDVDRTDFVSPETGYVEVVVTARIPADASGSYWALVGLASEPPARSIVEQGVAIRLIPRVTIPIVVTVEGTTKPQLNVLQTHATKRDRGVDVESTVENSGNTAVLISAAFSVERQEKGAVDAEELSGTTVGPLTSLPGTKLKVRGHLDYEGSVTDVQVHAYVRYGAGGNDTVEAVAKIEDPSSVKTAKGGATSHGSSH